MAWFEDVVFFSVAVRCPWRLNSHSAECMCLMQKPSRCHRLMCPRLQRDCMPYVLWPAAPEHHLQLPFRICLPKPAWSMLTAPLALPQAHVRSRCRMPAPVVTSAHHCDALMLQTIVPQTLSSGLLGAGRLHNAVGSPLIRARLLQNAPRAKFSSVSQPRVLLAECPNPATAACA